MGVEIVSAEMGVSSPVMVSICTVVTPSFWRVLEALPNNAKEMSVVEEGDMPNSLTISVDI